MSGGGSLLELWQRHVLECSVCGHARTPDQLCQVGKNFWGMAGSAVPGAAPLPVARAIEVPVVPVAPAVPAAPVAPVMPMAPMAPPMPIGAESASYAVSVQVTTSQQSTFDIGQLAARVAERVIARTESGAAIAVPMEKTSRAVEIATAPGVILRMPERDIEVYTGMKAAIGRLLRLAEALGTYILAAQEAHSLARQSGVTIGSDEVALVVSHVTRQRGMNGVNAETIYREFSAVKEVVIRLGDVMGRLMKVDADTQVVMREVRTLGVDMQGELERSPGMRLALDEETRKITRALRLVAVSLQGELERRLGA